VEIHFQGLLPDKIQSDQSRFQQILMNLLSNSNKFQSNAVIDVTVSMDSQNKELLIQVRDHGVGIKKKD
jgi:signal transduction histidine kinase